MYLWVQIHIHEPVCGCRMRHSDVLPQEPSAFLFWGIITHWPGLGSSSRPVWLTRELQESTCLFLHSIGITNHAIWILGLKFMSLFMKSKNSVDRELPLLSLCSSHDGLYYKPAINLATKMVFIYTPFSSSSYQNKSSAKCQLSMSMQRHWRRPHVRLLITWNTSNCNVPSVSKDPCNGFSGTNHVHDYTNELSMQIKIWKPIHVCAKNITGSTYLYKYGYSQLFTYLISIYCSTIEQAFT